MQEVAVAGALIASFVAIGAAAWATVRRRVRTHASAPGTPAPLAPEPGRTATAATDVTTAVDGPELDGKSGFALNACVFANASVEHVCWTAMVVDPALQDTPSHVRLVGHYETELAAVDAAAHLAKALNECLIPGEAPLTATALGIEPAVGSAEDVDPAAASDGTATRPAQSPASTNRRRRFERSSREPRNRFGLPIAYTGTPLAGHVVLADLDDAPFSHR